MQTRSEQPVALAPNRVPALLAMRQRLGWLSADEIDRLSVSVEALLGSSNRWQDAYERAEERLGADELLRKAIDLELGELLKCYLAAAQQSAVLDQRQLQAWIAIGGAALGLALDDLPVEDREALSGPWFSSVERGKAT